MLVGNSICEDQSESDRELEDGFFSDDEIYSDSDDGLWLQPLKVFPVLMYQLRHNIRMLVQEV